MKKTSLCVWRSVLVAVVLAVALVASPRRAAAFCGFYVGGAGAKLFNEATVVVMMRDGTRTVLSMQNAYKGPPEKFAMVVPVPVVLREGDVKTLPRELFDRVDQLAAPRLVEYWEEDPCAGGRGGGFGFAKRSMAPPTSAASPPTGAGYGVKIEAAFVVGEYQIVILSAADSAGLDAWLRNEQYAIPDGAEPYLRPYVASGSKFFVAKVDVAKVKMEGGAAMLSPLRVQYDSDDFRLPVRLGLVNSSGTQDLVVHVLARTRYEVANYPNVTIPTNLDVSEAARASFATFYTTLFDQTLARNPKAVVTEYAWASATTCDPCPGPALDPHDLATLGADVTGGAGAGGDFIITRLHARYTKDALGEDLVFREAPPIVGGREATIRGKLEHGATPSSYNYFQARYAIRHPWTGPVTCKEPVRGRWGGPPGAGLSTPEPKAAEHVGLAPHTKADLASFVTVDVPEIGFTAPAAARRSGCSGCALGARSDAGPHALAAAVLLGVAAASRRLRRGARAALGSSRNPSP